MGLHRQHAIDVRRLAAAARADEPDANPLIGPLRAFIGDGELRLKHARRRGRGRGDSSGAQEIATIARLRRNG